jgi:hypothetical protein
MLIARKFVLLCAMALAALALGATSASAQETGVEVIEELSGDPCSVAAPCRVHAEGTSELHEHVGGVPVEVSACDDEFEANVFGDGSGVIDVYNNNASTSVRCLRRKCNGVGEPVSEATWPIYDAGETGPNVGHMWVDFCIDTVAAPNGAGAHCTVEVQVEEDPLDDHHYIFSVDSWTCPTLNLELTGEWETENPPTSPHEGIEIVHV